MTTDYDDKARLLAARITQRLTADTPPATSDDIAELRAGLGEVLQRLSVIESRMVSGPSQTPVAKYHVADTKTQTPKLHPSQERFNLEPAVAEMVDFLEDVKRCSFEPGNKPCDNCAMCTARGF